MEDALKVLGHALILKLVVGDTMVNVGTLPQGCVHNVTLPRIPLQQSTSSNEIHMIPDYYKVTHGVPPYNTSHMIVKNAAYVFSPAWHAIAINT